MRLSSRFEYKYLLTLSEYYALKHSLTPFITPDEYTQKSDKKRYLVRSLYYDTHHLKAFHERDEGIFGRIKLRLRVYTNKYLEQETLSIELKTKKGLNMVKYSALMPLNNYPEFLEKNTFNDDVKNQVVEEFLRLMHVRQLTPQLLVEYEREGYISKFKEPLRLTFDHNVSSARAKTLFEDDLNLKIHQPSHVIFEIKCEQERPKWLNQIIKKHRLKMTSNSKYVQGIEIIKPLMITKQDAYFFNTSKSKNHELRRALYEK